MAISNIVELMAPAGNWACLNAALQAGAGSVYFGVEQLNMRSRSSNNFTLEDLSEIGRICRDHDVKTYLTLNTVLYDEDLPLMKTIIKEAKKAGISAIIAADQAAIMYARKQGVNVHISTQANITNIEMVEFYSQFSDVMVLARELNLKKVAAITKAIKKRKITGPSGNLVKIEVFVHGALCMAVSGKCYLSLHTYNRSANRGECNQNCRHAYQVTSDDGTELEIDNKYIMSPKDLCTLPFLDEILDASVSVLKIEGRGRSPEYVKTVTRTYREAIEAIARQNFTQENVEKWMEHLKEVYNRGFWDGYYLGRKLGEWSSVHGSASTRKKEFSGKVLHYYPKAGVAHIRVKSKEILQDKPLLIIGNATGVVETVPHSLWVDEKPASKAGKGEECTIKIEEKVRAGDKVYVWEERTPVG